MEIIELNKKDFFKFSGEIAELHLDAYSKRHFTSQFSLTKLEEYYLHLLTASDISIIAVESGHVTGFIVSGYNMSYGVSTFIEENKIYLFLKLLTNPSFLFQKIRRACFSKWNKIRPSKVEYRLLSIAVSPDKQAKGTGKAMLKKLEQSLRNRGIDTYGLSVRKKNERAIAFYEKNGFVLEKEHLGSRYYVKQIQGESNE